MLSFQVFLHEVLLVNILHTRVAELDLDWVPQRWLSDEAGARYTPLPALAPESR